MKSDFRSGLRDGVVAVDGVEFYKEEFVLNDFKKTWNAETKRLNFPNLDKHLRNNITSTYIATKAVLSEVPKHCGTILEANYLYTREALCLICSHKVREVEQKLNNFPIKAGFKLQETVLLRLLIAQAVY